MEAERGERERSDQSAVSAEPGEAAGATCSGDVPGRTRPCERGPPGSAWSAEVKLVGEPLEQCRLAGEQAERMFPRPEARTRSTS